MRGQWFCICTTGPASLMLFQLALDDVAVAGCTLGLE
jgi:hypothetical protein